MAPRSLKAIERRQRRFRLTRLFIIAFLIAVVLSPIGSALAQNGCLSCRCSPVGTFWPMRHTNGTHCGPDAPTEHGCHNFEHGQVFAHITLSADSNIVGTQPCYGGAPDSVCSDPNKSGFIYATDFAKEHITQAEYDSQVPYICDDGVIHAGSEVYTPAYTPTETPTATPTPTPTLIPTWGEVEGNSPETAYGISVAPAGDVNGDGYPDVIVGAEWLTHSEFREGGAYVYPGSARGLLTVPIWTAEVNQGGALFGHSVASAGDVNGDGYDDVIVGALFYDSGQENEGAAFLYFGSATGLSSSPAWRGESNQAAALYGWSVSSAGDLNNDGYDDVIVGAKHYDHLTPDLPYFWPGLGRAYVYYGSAAGLPTTPSWSFDGEVSSYGMGANFGTSVSRAGDVDKDGYDDVIIGADSFDNCTGCNGVAYLFRGSATGLSSTYTLRLSGNRQKFDDPTAFGGSVASAGDVNGDGYDDVVIGAKGPGGGSTEGAYLFAGSASGLQSIASWQGRAEMPYTRADLGYGSSVASAGDVNKDGYSDVIVGAVYFSNGEIWEGAAFLYLGSAAGLTTSAVWRQESNREWGYYGVSVASTGDVNQDGYSEVIVGGCNITNGHNSEGKAFLYSDFAQLVPGGMTGGTPTGTPTSTPTQTPVNTATATATITATVAPNPRGVATATYTPQGVTTGFQPSQISGLSLWLNSADMGSLFQNSDRTGAVADGDPIGFWSDLSGNSNHAIQGTAGQRPSLSAVTYAENGYGGVLFDGGNDFVAATHGLGTNPNYTLLMVSRLIAATTSSPDKSFVTIGNTGGNWQIDFIGYPTNYNSSYFGVRSPFNDREASPQTSLLNKPFNIFTAIQNGSDPDIFVNYDLYNIAGLGGTKMFVNRVEIGRGSAFAAGPGYSQVVMYEVLLYNRVLSNAEISQLQTYLDQKWLVLADANPPPTLTPDSTATSTAMPEDTATATYTATATPADTATATHTATATPQDTATATFTATATPPDTATATYTATSTPADTETSTPTPVDTATATPAVTVRSLATPADTATLTATPADTVTATFTATDTPTDTPTHTPTDTAVDTPSVTLTGEPVGSDTPMPLDTPTISAPSTPIPSFADPVALECTDLIDNDGDGLTDSQDPDCQSPTATRESGSTTFTVSLEGLYDNKDGTLVAYFSYKNDSGKVITAPRGDSPTTRNIFSPEPASRGQPTDFLPGEHRGVYRVEFNGAPFVWTIKVPGYDEIQIPVSSESPKLPAVRPVPDCINKSETGGFISVWGYNNPNDFELVIPIGPRNMFVPGKGDRGQPDKFFAGLNRGAFTLPLSDILEWKLPGASASASPKANVCICPSTDNTTSKDRILKFSQELGALVYEAADQIEQASKARFTGASADAKKRLREGIQRSKKRAAEAALEAQEFNSSLPIVSRSCPEVPVGCRQVDDGATLEKLRKYHYDTLALIKRMNARSEFIERGRTKRNEEIVRRANKIFKRGLAEINKIPRFRTVCK